MRMIDLDRKQSVRSFSVYLTPSEAESMKEELETLLKDPEAREHFHIQSEDYSREVSCSIITEEKLRHLNRYNKLEQKVLSEE